jgi:hypothetical protein
MDPLRATIEEFAGRLGAQVKPGPTSLRAIFISLMAVRWGVEDNAEEADHFFLSRAVTTLASTWS